MISIPIGFLSFSLASVRLFYSQRLGGFPDQDPNPKMTVFALPFVVTLTAAPFASLVLAATVFQANVLALVVAIVVVNFLVLYFLYIRKAARVKYLELYSGTTDPQFESQNLAKAHRDCLAIFYTAALTSWVAPCAVLANNFQVQTRFLLVSSIVSLTAHSISISAVTVWIQFQNKTLFCQQFHESNATTDHFEFDSCPILMNSYYAFILLFLSILSAWCLQHLGNYLNVFRWTKWLSAIVHVSLMHDFLENCDKLTPEVQAELGAAMDTAVASDASFANIKDPAHGNTLLHTALKVRNFDILLKLIQANANFIIPNNYLESVHSKVSQLLQDTSLTKEDQRKVRLLRAITEQNKIDHVNSVLIKVWKEQPLFLAIRKGSINLVSLLLLLGGKVGSWNESDTSFFNLLLKAINDQPEKFTRAGIFIKWYLTQLTNFFGNTLLLRASQSGIRHFPEILLAFNAKMRNKKDGFTALHSAAKAGNVDLALILLKRGGAEVNATEFSKQSSLHVAVTSRQRRMAELLLANGKKLIKEIFCPSIGQSCQVFDVVITTLASYVRPKRRHGSI